MKYIFTLACVCIICITKAQESSFSKFGKVTAEHLKQSSYEIDKEAKGVILSDIGFSSIEGNSKGWFSVRSERHQVVHILTKSGYSLADLEIPLYRNGNSEEMLVDLKAVTYNLQNGAVVESKLDKGNVFTEKRSRNLTIKKFTMPNVREGSIIEVQYKVTSDFISQIDPWYFQGSVPRLWSEFNFTVPKFFNYRFLSHGHSKFFVQATENANRNFNIMISKGAGPMEFFKINSEVFKHRWVRKDVPELKEELYTTALKNYISRLELQLVSQSDPLKYHNYVSTWPALTKELLESEHFGKQLTSNNNWLADDMKVLIASAKNDMEKAKAIYQFVRDQFSVTSSRGTYVNESLKSIYKEKKGNVAEINLILVAMLRHAGIKADPIILSTTDNGIVYDIYPDYNRFNYTICQARIDSRIIHLDASQKNLGFGKLLPNCYNGIALVVNEEASQINLEPDKLVEAKVINVSIFGLTKDGWKGKVSYNPGYYESYSIRTKINETGVDQYLKELQKEYGQDIQVKAPVIDSLKDFDMPLKVKYDLDLGDKEDNIVYVQPVLGDTYKLNPFKSATRYYPVEMPYAIDETYNFHFVVPEEYAVDELPKSVKANLEEDGSSFYEYLITTSSNVVSMRSRLKLSRTIYEPEEYEDLREFFNLIVKKHAEQIVLKKK